MSPEEYAEHERLTDEVERLRKDLDKALDRQLEYANRAIANGERAEQARALVETALDLRMHAKRWDRGWNRWDTEAERFLRAPETPHPTDTTGETETPDVR